MKESSFVLVAVRLIYFFLIMTTHKLNEKTIPFSWQIFRGAQTKFKLSSVG